MSVELAEANILAEQMHKELKHKKISSYNLKDYEKLQKIGMFNRNIEDFKLLIDRKIESVISRGNVILLKLDKEVNLILGLEYGGRIFYFNKLSRY